MPRNVLIECLVRHGGGSFDVPFVCGNRTRRERWNSVQVRGGQQNEFPVWRPDNLGCAVPRMELSIRVDGVPLERPLSVRLVDGYIRGPDTARHPQYSCDLSDRLPVHGHHYDQSGCALYLGVALAIVPLY